MLCTTAKAASPSFQQATNIAAYQAFIATNGNLGISAATATNISEYQASTVTNSTTGTIKAGRFIGIFETGFGGSFSGTELGGDVLTAATLNLGGYNGGHAEFHIYDGNTNETIVLNANLGTITASFIGNGAGLTNIPLATVTGTLPVAALPTRVLTNLSTVDWNLSSGNLAVGGQIYSRSATFPVITADRTSTGIDTALSAFGVRQTTTGNMVDGFGVGITFQIQDNANVTNPIVMISGDRDGADNSGAFVIRTYTNGVSTERFRVGASGAVQMVGTLRATNGVAVGATSTVITNISTATATLDFGSILAATSADLTVTVGGAKANDIVTLGPPTALESTVTAIGFVSSANTVTVRLFNIGDIASDPASATWRVQVQQYQ